MKKKQFPFYPFLLAAFPVLSLMAANKFEVRLTVVFRPLIIFLFFALILYILFSLIYKRDLSRAALLTGITLILFFSYGHIFKVLDSSGFINTLNIRHRHLLFFFGLIWVGTLVLLFFWKIKDDITKVLNIFSVILIAMPLAQMIWFYLGEIIVSNRVNHLQQTENSAAMERNYSPDVYYIILDMYARPDALLEEYDIDVNDFIEEMEALGFYYAAESQSNYGETFTSLSTSLNLRLLDEYLLEKNIVSGSFTYNDLLIHSETRSIFENLDYQTIAFSTGYRWSELTDVDIYYQIESTNKLRALTPFETLLFKNTIIYPFRGYLFALIPAIDIDSGGANTTQNLHIETQRNILEILPEITQNNHPTFTFAHILVPHPPFVFDEDGSILQDPGYYSGKNASAVNDFYDLDGYTRQVKFISQKILTISRQILMDSDTPPIIVIQADHGWKGEDRHKILNLYYFPDQDYGSLYPSITPVNSFRVIFSQYFNLDFSLVEDRIFQE